MTKAPISVIILTYNEEANLRACLESVAGLSDEVLVVDSFSTDKTLEIAREQGAQIYQNPWVNWAHQRNWALEHLPLSHDWVIFLDADERLTPELGAELAEILPHLPGDVGGLYSRRRFIWMGRWLKHGGNYKWILRTVRREKARVEMSGGWEYMRVRGKTQRLRHDIIHEDLKGAGDWVIKHNRYASQEALELLSSPSGQASRCGWQAAAPGVNYETESGRIVKLRSFWNRLPPFFRPPLNFIIRYFFMLGLLDGLAGLSYYFLHDLWYPFLVDVYLLELRKKARAVTGN